MASVRRMSAQIPAFCPVHGMQPSGIVVENSTGVKLEGNISRCPVCGGDARVIDGTFTVAAETIRVLAAPAWSLAKLRELQSALAWAQATLPSQPDAAVARVQEVSPVTANLLKRLLDSPRTASVSDLIQALLAALAIILTLRGAGDRSLTPEQVEQVITRVIEQTSGAESGQVPALPPPATTPGPGARGLPLPPPDQWRRPGRP